MEKKVADVQNKYVDAAVGYIDADGKYRTLVLRNIPIGFRNLLGSLTGCEIDEVTTPRDGVIDMANLGVKNTEEEEF